MDNCDKIKTVEKEYPLNDKVEESPSAVYLIDLFVEKHNITTDGKGELLDLFNECLWHISRLLLKEPGTIPEKSIKKNEVQSNEHICMGFKKNGDPCQRKGKNYNSDEDAWFCGHHSKKK